MGMESVPLPSIEAAIRDVCLVLDEEKHQPPSWETLPEEELWRELVACILGSRVRAECVQSAMSRIDKSRVLVQYRKSSNFDRFEREMIRVLSAETVIGRNPIQCSRYPFFKSRAGQLRRAAESIYAIGGTVHAFLEMAPDSLSLRRLLVSNVTGLGPKQASLFLRNIGYTSWIAVLDVHVLTYMGWVGLIEPPIKTVPNLDKYEMLEDVFLGHSTSLGYPPDRLDIAIWVVVRVAKEVYR